MKLFCSATPVFRVLQVELWGLDMDCFSRTETETDSDWFSGGFLGVVSAWNKVWLYRRQKNWSELWPMENTSECPQRRVLFSVLNVTYLTLTETELRLKLTEGSRPVRNFINKEFTEHWASSWFIIVAVVWRKYLFISRHRDGSDVIIL